MSHPVYFYLLVEGLLDEMVARKLLLSFQPRYAVAQVFGAKGKGYLKAKAKNFNQASKNQPYFMLTDLDSDPCPLALIEAWLPQGRHPNFILRVAVRSVEAWLLADAENLAAWLQVSVSKIPRQPETLAYPKRALIDLARKSRSKDIRQALIPSEGSTAQEGKYYTSELAKFVQNKWNVLVACQNSPSLAKAYKALAHF